MNKAIEDIYETAYSLVYKDKVGTIELYSKAIDILKGKTSREAIRYNILTHYHILDISKDLDRGKYEKIYKAKALEYAHKCIDLITPFLEDDNSPHYADSVMTAREASITIAKDAYENAIGLSQKPKLQKAFEIIDLASKHQSDYDDIHFTKAQILLKLKKEKEAYAVVAKAIGEDADVEVYEEILTSQPYRDWYDSSSNDFNKEAIEFLTTAKRIINNISPKNIIPENANKSNNYTSKLIALEDAIKNYDFDDASFVSAADSVLIIEGDLYIDGDLNTEWIEAESKKHDPECFTSNLIVEGNLYVNDDIYDGRVEDLICLKINKDVYANNITSSDGLITFKGTTYVKYVMYGHYNDGHIYTNKLYCPYFICDNHDMSRDSENESISIDGSYYAHKSEIKIDADNEDGYLKQSDKLFNPEIWEDDQFDISSFFYLVNKGINPFKEID